MTTLPRRLTAGEKAVLCALADPAGPTPALEDIAACDAQVLIGAAMAHGVDPVAVRKLGALDLAGHLALIEQRARATENLTMSNAIAMALDAHREIVGRAMAQEGIGFTPVKGAAFARDLYPHLADRPYSDIDILVAEDGLGQAAEVMRALDYTQHQRRRFDKSEANREQKWVREGDRHVLIELHTDLVHFPALRRRLRFGFAEHALASDGGRRAFAGHLVTAVIHAAAGHKFHNLKLLIDVLQAIRALTPADVTHLKQVRSQLQMAPELAMCLHLTGALWPAIRTDENWHGLAEIAAPDSVPSLVTADAVIDAPLGGYGASRLRRHAFRWYQLTR